jgi:hypothetical protein
MGEGYYSLHVGVRDGAVMIKVVGKRLDIKRDGDLESIEFYLSPDDAEILAKRILRASRQVIPGGAREMTRRMASLEAKVSAQERAIQMISRKLEEIRKIIEETKKTEQK